MAGAGDVGLASLLDRLEGAGLAGRDVMRPAAGADELLELVVEALVAEVALLLGDPLLQAEMRLDDELGHGVLPSFSEAGSAPFSSSTGNRVIETALREGLTPSVLLDRRRRLLHEAVVPGLGGSMVAAAISLSNCCRKSSERFWLLVADDAVARVDLQVGLHGGDVERLVAQPVFLRHVVGDLLRRRLVDPHRASCRRR